MRYMRKYTCSVYIDMLARQKATFYIEVSQKTSSSLISTGLRAIFLLHHIDQCIVSYRASNDDEIMFESSKVD